MPWLLHASPSPLSVLLLLLLLSLYGCLSPSLLSPASARQWPEPPLHRPLHRTAAARGTAPDTARAATAAPSAALADAALHGWDVVDFAFDPSLPVVYLIDGYWQVVALNTTSRMHALWAYQLPPGLVVEHIQVDSQHVVYVTAFDYTAFPPTASHLLTFDAQLRPLQNASLASLKPVGVPTLLVLDSNRYLYLFTDSVYFPQLNPTVWVLEPRRLVQVDAWQAPIPILPRSSPNFTSYLLAIDADDLLYFQQTTAGQRTLIASTGGDAVATLDLLAGRAVASNPVSDLAVDAALNVYLTSLSSSSVDVFDSNGRPLPRLAVLSQGSGYPGPQLGFDLQGQLQVSDHSEQVILSVSAAGYVVRSLGSSQATVNDFSTQLLIDQRTGDLVAFDGSRPTTAVAVRLSAEDGRLLQTYQLAEPVLQDCDVLGLDVGGVQGGLYFLLQCSNADGGVASRVHALRASGGVQLDLLIPGQAADRIRVDESADRLYLTGYGGERSEGLVHVLDLQGRPLRRITADPPLGYLADFVVASGPDGGGELLLLDNANARVVGVDRDGSITFTTDLRAYDELRHVASAGRGEMYLSVTEVQFVGSELVPVSFVARVERSGREVDRFVAGQPWDGPTFRALAARGDDLFAWDRRYATIFVWRGRSPTHSHLRWAEIAPGAAREEEEEASREEQQRRE